jgi:hypothetical protein
MNDELQGNEMDEVSFGLENVYVSEEVIEQPRLSGA